MSYFRSYFEKNNTIIKNSQVNTAKNPTTEIFYGSGFSKFLFKIDLTDLLAKINNGDLVLNENTKHTLHLTNTIFGDEGLKGQHRSTGRKRATSFDLILFKIPETWDEGVGFDYEDGGFDFTSGNNTFDERPSNWFNRRTVLVDGGAWTTNGVYSTDPIIVSGSTWNSPYIRFDNGNEDIDLDITNYINNVIDGGVDYGLGLAFAVPYQDVNTDVDQSVAFFTKYTQTFFEPYLESFFDDRIEDNRHNFVEKTNQNLFLYVNKGKNPYDLDELPLVDILNGTTLVEGLGNIESVKVRKGVYKITFGVDNILCDGKRFLFDKWKNIRIDGVSVSDITQKFIPKPLSSLYKIGENQTELNRYSIQFFGIKQNEKVKRGELRKIVVSFRSINELKGVLLDEVYYRMFIKEGRTDVLIHDWTQIDTTNENSFILDTSFYIPREYFLEIKGKVYGEELFYDNYIKFEILSEK